MFNMTLLIYVIVTVIGVVLLCFLLCKKRNLDEKILIIIAVVSMGISICVGSFILPDVQKDVRQTVTEETSEIVYEKEIINLQDGGKIEGNFFLLAGEENEKMYYCYYTQEEEGYKFNKISPEDNDSEVYIKYCKENETPKIVETKKQIISKEILTKKPDFWTCDIFDYFICHKYDVGDSIKFYEHEFDNKNITTIYVPEGSITNEYQIDME